MAASFPQTLIPLVCSITLLLTLATTPGDATSLTGHTTSFTSHNFNSYYLEGDAYYLNNTDEVGLIRMTKTNELGTALRYSAGRVVYSKPFQFWGEGMQIDFEGTLKFIINPNSGDTDPADGFTFFIEPVGAPIGSVGGSFGEFDWSGKKASTFAIEFDIYQDRNDPSYPHVGIDIESTTSIVTMEVGDALLGQVVTAHIDYKAAKSEINVNVTIGSNTYVMSCLKDLSTVLPQMVHFGFSAATGTHVAVHDLISWQFNHIVYAEEGSGGIRQVM